MAKKIQIKLCVELVPSTCHYSNVRSTVSTKDWNTLRKYSYEQAGYVCEICGQTGLEQGYKFKLECHEIWEYKDDKKVQKLVGLISLCPLCHAVKHIGRAFAMGKQARVFQHLEEVNGWTHKQVVSHVGRSYMVNKQRSKHPWALDLKVLTKEPYNVTVNLRMKRVFKKKKYTRKKRKK